MAEQVMTWNDDGHSIQLRLSKSELEITGITCPNRDTGNCNDPVHGCVVTYFIRRFGLECNAGTCPPAESIDICWTLIGDSRVIEECQLWFMPKSDEVFSAWLETKQSKN
jgi:hypothetical protein